MGFRWGRGRRWEYVKPPAYTGDGGAGAVIRALSTLAIAAISSTTSSLRRRTTLPTTDLSSVSSPRADMTDELGAPCDEDTIMKETPFHSSLCSALANFFTNEG